MRKFLAGLLAFVFILGFALNVIGWAALDALFSPRTYTAIIRHPEFVSTVARLAREQVTAQVLQQAGALGPYFTAEDAAWAAEQLITGPWLSAQIERWLGPLFDWIKSDQPHPHPPLVLSLTELKQEIPAVAEMLLAEKLRQLPPCTLERVVQALEALLSGREVPLCLPPNFDVDGFVRSDILNLRGNVVRQMELVPDTVDILALAQDSEDGALLIRGLQEVRQGRQQALRYLTLLGAALLGVLLLIGLLRWRPKRALLQWWGWALLLGGGLALAMFGTVYEARTALWTWVATSPNGALPAGLAAVARAAFDGVLASVWGRVVVIGGGAGAAGLLLAVLAFALPRGDGAGA